VPDEKDGAERHEYELKLAWEANQREILKILEAEEAGKGGKDGLWQGKKGCESW